MEDAHSNVSIPDGDVLASLHMHEGDDVAYRKIELLRIETPR